MPIDVEAVLRTPASSWSDDEKTAVFEWLLRTELTRMVRFAHGCLSRCHAANEAEDCVQDALVGLFRYFRSYDPNAGAFLAWVYTAIRHEAIRRCRRRLVAGRQVALQENEAYDVELSDSVRGTRHPILDADYIELLAFLPQDEAQAIDLIHRLGCTREEAALKLGCRTNTMTVRYFSARHRLASIHGHLETIGRTEPGRARTARLFIGMQLPLAEVARRTGADEASAALALAEAFLALVPATFVRGTLLHQEVRERVGQFLVSLKTVPKDGPPKHVLLEDVLQRVREALGQTCV